MHHHTEFHIAPPPPPPPSTSGYGGYNSQSTKQTVDSTPMNEVKELVNCYRGFRASCQSPGQLQPIRTSQTLFRQQNPQRGCHVWSTSYSRHSSKWTDTQRDRSPLDLKKNLTQYAVAHAHSQHRFPAHSSKLYQI